MSGIQKEATVDDLKRIIAVQYREILLKNERLKGLEDLTRICSELEEKRQSWQTRADNFETALRRAESRIAYLNKKLGIGPQTAFDIDVVNPGVSRKDFDAVIKEDIKFKEALEHTVPTELGGKDVVVMQLPVQEEQTSLEAIEEKISEKIEELQRQIDTLSKRVEELTSEQTNENPAHNGGRKAKVAVTATKADNISIDITI